MDTSKQYKELSDKASPLKPDYVVEKVKWYEDPVYIKMCEKAEEIQGLLPCELKSKMTFEFEGGLYPPENLEYLFTIDGLITRDGIWLPRQDQLQEMSGLTWVEFDDCCRKYWFNDGRRETTKEIASIQVVMKEKYNKVWEEGQWKKKETN